MLCPSCKGTLIQVDLRDKGLMVASGCPACGGCWIAKDDLESAHAGVWGNVQAMGVRVAEALSSTLCPRCTVRCTEVSPEEHPELNIDRCPSCHGLWLDRGELDRLYEIVTSYAEAHGTLADKPAGWSAMRWLTYRLAQHWRHTQAGMGVD